MAGLGLPSPLVRFFLNPPRVTAVAGRLPELRRQGSHVMIPVQPIQPERGRLYSLGEEGENRNETKCEHGRGGAILI